MEPANHVERFEIAFNQIHSILKERSRNMKTDRFVDLLQENREKYGVLNSNYYKLKQYAKLRNAIVHERIEEEYYIADPHLNVVEDIERISEILKHPPKAMAIASQPVEFFKASSSLQKVLETIEQTGYSQFPIYERGHFQGLLTEGGIAKWVSRNIQNHSINLKGIAARDILEVEKRRNVACLSQEQTVYDVEDSFQMHYEKKQKLEAILITEDGNQDSSPLGIISAWDLVKIEHSTISLLSNS
ncbi:Predicted transcriptional regulator with C-terminal CBS domains [Salinibacillus kushneri]|uniref:Predicted transcriptional regulator with C-terminal CBS domains n=1 Tax=Salinibacillus kushneri TaxID=237682 RepID=A0A1I0FNX1_9BACI|nr:CBS domain-containing protein [Salinibacillus kushneri]SET60071.1 Predicted transcriptional regulator with C-terminal CBS domains [Salinibacillus kushneri]